METKRQRKLINYARLSRVGVQESKSDSLLTTLPCTSCGKKFMQLMTFYVHIVHCTNINHACPSCPEELEASNEENKGESDEKENKSNAEYSCAEELDEHISAHHPDTYPFQCYVCELNFSALSGLQKHQLYIHKIRPNTHYQKPKIEFPCTSCRKMFDSANELAQHFTSESRCCGNPMLWQCVDPETDAEDDISIRLRDCLASETDFNNRFPRSRIGVNFFISTNLRPQRPSASYSKLVHGERRSRLKPRSAYTSESSDSDTSDSYKPYATSKRSKSASMPKRMKKVKNQTPKVKLVNKRHSREREIASAVAAINKKLEKNANRAKKRSQPATNSPTKTLDISKRMILNEHDDDEKKENDSPKRRRIDDFPSGDILDDEGEREDDILSSPEAPFGVQGVSPGLEPEDDDDDDDDVPQIIQPPAQIGALAADFDDDDDSRVAHAVEMDVCRACGITFDSFIEYADHMKTVHDITLPSSARGRVKPKKKGAVENEPSSMKAAQEAIDRAVKHVNQALYNSHRANVASLNNPAIARKRSKKSKSANQPVGDSTNILNTAEYKPLLCPLCPDRPSFYSCDDRETHLATLHDGERAFGCQACGETFSLFYELQLHTRQEHDIGKAPPIIVVDPARAKLAYKCVVCKVGFQDESILQRHYDAMHTLDEGEQYHCPVCYFTYSGCRTRDDHVLKKHPEARAYKCPVCEARFASFEVFRAHEKRAHISQKTRLRSGMATHGPAVENAHIMMGLMEKPKKPRRKLAAAMRGALGEKTIDSVKEASEKRRKLKLYREGTLYCEKCNEDCANEEELEIHTKEHVRKEKRFGCTQCGRVFSGPLARSFLVDHIKLEHMHQSAYVCDDCGQRFYYKVQSDRHRTVDRDSGVASCKRFEDLNIPVPRVVYGCSRCAKIFAGEGAQSRYTEHQVECISNQTPPADKEKQKKDERPAPPLPPPPPQSPPIHKQFQRREENEVALAISEAVGILGNTPMVDEEPKIPLTQSSRTENKPEKTLQKYADDESNNVGMVVASDALCSQQEDVDSSSQDSNAPESQQTVIVLPSSNPEVEGEEGGQVVVLPEDVLSNVRAAGLDDGSGSVVLIQAEDGTLIVASEEQLAELQMQENVDARSQVRDMLQDEASEVKDDGDTG